MKYCAMLLIMSSLLHTAGATPLARRIWQLQDYDMSYINRVIDLAPQYGINEIQLSHRIIMDAHQPLNNSKLAEDINSICQRAHKKGLKVSVWTHELAEVPSDFVTDNRVDMENPRLWKWLQEKYDRLFQTCANIDGIVLTFHETEVPVYHDSKVISRLTPAERVARLIDVIAGVCKSRGKYLVVRSFCYEPSELQFIKDGFALAKSDFTVMTKCQPHDWQPFYPDNPLIGNVSGHPQIVEIDCGHEFLGQADIPYIDVEYVKRRLSYGVSKGIVGAVARIERYSNHALDSPNWADVFVFSKLLQDPSDDPNRLLNEYLAKRYGRVAAPTLATALSRTFDIVNKTFFALGFWMTDHSRIPSFNYALSHLQNIGVDKWDSDPKWTNIKKTLLSPDTRTLNEIHKEKTQALALCRRSIKDVESLCSVLSTADYEELMSYLRREEAVVLTWRAYFDAFFGTLAFQRDPREEYRIRVENALDELQEFSTKYGQELREVTGDGGADNVTRVKQFVTEIRERLAKSSGKTVSQ